MDRFFSIFGKVALILIVLGAMAYGGYYFGTQTKSNNQSEAITTTLDEEKDVQEIVIPTEKPLVTLIGGVNKSAGLSFDQYSITVPDGWLSKKESQTALDEKLTLTKDGYTVSIFQAATGGALCLYPGDAPFEGPSSKYEVFINLTTNDSRKLRRSGDKNGTSFTICQKSPDGSFQQPTSYGHISVKLPEIWDQTVINEIDTMISSLKKI